MQVVIDVTWGCRCLGVSTQYRYSVGKEDFRFWLDLDI